MKTFPLVFLLLSACLIMVLPGCGVASPRPALAPQQVTVIVPATVIATAPAVVATRIVLVTAASAAPGSVSRKSKDPETVIMTRRADPWTLDPALRYDAYGLSVINNVYETLVINDGTNPNAFVPQLATDMPVISSDGLDYTFIIREGIKFHEGGDLTPEDVAFTFQRGLLQGGYSSPQLLLTEPILGVGIYDVSEMLFADDPDKDAKFGNPAAVQLADPGRLIAVCERVQSKIVADDKGVTFHLENAWAPFIASLVGNWGAIMDKEWVIENGGWDGDCATWQDHYGLVAENNPFHAILNGTGPYKFERWIPDLEIVLVANEAYWRTEATGPAWEGGPVGIAPVKTIVMRVTNVWGTQYLQLLEGDLDFSEVPPGTNMQMDALTGEICDYSLEIFDYICAPTAIPDGPFRLLRGYPANGRGDLLLNWAINPSADNPHIGSGRLDGNGIPPDFFSDVHVRRAFNYCFDWDVYTNDVLGGQVVQNIGVTMPGMLGYNPDGSTYSRDLEKCGAELAQAWGGVLPETGFRLQFVYPIDGPELQAIGEILQENLARVNERYVLEVVGTTVTGYVALRENNYLPAGVFGWIEDYHDPHNWAQPYFMGYFAERSHYSEEMKAQLREKVTAAVAATDPAARQALYEELNEFDYENALAVRLVVGFGSGGYEHRYLHWHHAGQYYYGMWKE